MCYHVARLLFHNAQSFNKVFLKLYAKFCSLGSKYNICKRQFTDKVIVAHARVMEETKATYPFKHSEYNSNKGNTEVTIENPYESKVPTRFILRMVDADSYIGKWKRNPPNFKHYDISCAAFYIDDESICKPPYKLDPAKGKFIEPFMELYSILGENWGGCRHRHMYRELSGRNIHLTFLCDSHISCRYGISGQKNRRELQDKAAIS